MGPSFPSEHIRTFFFDYMHRRRRVDIFCAFAKVSRLVEKCLYEHFDVDSTFRVSRSLSIPRNFEGK